MNRLMAGRVAHLGFAAPLPQTPMERARDGGSGKSRQASADPEQLLLACFEGMRRVLKPDGDWRVHLDHEPRRSVSARASDIAGNTEASSLVCSQLVLWAPGRRLDKPRGNLGNSPLFRLHNGWCPGISISLLDRIACRFVRSGP